MEFLKRSGEEALQAFVAAFATVFLAAGDGLGKAAAVAGVVAGVRAVLGVLAKPLGRNTESPSVLG